MGENIVCVRFFSRTTSRPLIRIRNVRTRGWQEEAFEGSQEAGQRDGRRRRRIQEQAKGRTKEAPRDAEEGGWKGTPDVWRHQEKWKEMKEIIQMQQQQHETSQLCVPNILI